jgi:phospholipase/carboxylesterase
LATRFACSYRLEARTALIYRAAVLTGRRCYEKADAAQQARPRRWQAMSSDLGFVHRFEAGDSNKALLLLHGTGGDENDLIGFGQAVAPGWALLSPRGKVLEHGMPRFFRRIAEGVFDEADLKRRAGELADFIAAAAKAYGFDQSKLVALGYSNGANIASAMMVLRPEAVRAAALLRPMVPFEISGHIDRAEKSVLLLSGEFDPIAPPVHSARLETIFNASGAEVARHVLPVSHGLSQADLTLARQWLGSLAL